jgi:hypothetical protein
MDAAFFLDICRSTPQGTVADLASCWLLGDHDLVGVALNAVTVTAVPGHQFGTPLVVSGVSHSLAEFGSAWPLQRLLPSLE